MSENGFEVIGISSSGKALRMFSKMRELEHILLKCLAVFPFKDLKSVWQLYKIFKKKTRYCSYPHTKAGTVGMLAAWLARVPR